MCGIAGTVNLSDTQWLLNIQEKISHRGPDDEGVFTHANVSLCHHRLAIQDLSPNGHQPMFSADGRYVIIFNGEIYNHIEIREKLSTKYSFKSTSDTETLLYGFMEYGVDLFAQLNGIFAFAVYDTQTQLLTVARDQFGIKPLYYYLHDGVFYFSSELKAFSDLPDFDKSIDYPALVNYLVFLWSPGEQTPFAHVKKLLPGHYITLQSADLASFQMTKYYEIPFKGAYSTKSEKALLNELDERLHEAVRRQLLSDVPVGFFLSGGLDSSGVVALAKRLLPKQQLQCYTIDTGYEGKKIEGFVDDLQYAKKVAQFLDVNLRIVEAKSDIVRDFDKVIYHLDEPQADAAPMNVLNICRQAREDGYVVLLGGTAGDDLFSGYRRHQAIRIEDYLRLVPHFLLKGAKNLTTNLDLRNPLYRRFQKLFRNIDVAPIERMVDYFAWLSSDTAKSLFSPAIQASLMGYEPSDILKNSLQSIPNEHNLLNQLLFWDMKYFLTDHNLNYTDKLSMAAGVEVRVPFLDIELVEFATQLPPDLKMKGTTTKYLLRKVMERYLPKEIIYRPKAGFGAPVREWILNDLDVTIHQYLSKESIEKRGIFNYSAVSQLIEDNKTGKIDASYSIWALLAIESWMRQFVDNA